MDSNKKAAPAEAAKETTSTSVVYATTLEVLSASETACRLPSSLREVEAFAISPNEALLTFESASKQSEKVFFTPAAAKFSAFLPEDADFAGPESTPICRCNGFVIYGEVVAGGLEFVELPSDIEWFDCTSVAMTIFSSESDAQAKAARKQYSCDEAGNLRKGDVGRFWNGIAKRYDDLPLDKLYRSLNKKQAPQKFTYLCAGVNSEAELKMGSLGGKKVQKRSKEDFLFPDGHALLVIDSDELGTWPELQSAEAVREVLARLGLDADCVTSSSASSYVTYPNGRNRLRGLHTFFAIDQGTQIPRVLEIIHKRAWLAGYGRILVGDNGVLHVRSVVDLAMKTPNQPIFEYGAVIHDPRITQDRQVKLHLGERRKIVAAELPDLSADEEAEFLRLVTDAKADLQLRAAEQTEIWLDRQTASLPEEERAAARASLMALRERKHRDLPPYFQIVTNDGQRIAVCEILANPEDWSYCSVRDPFEPEYGAGKATIFTKGQRDGRVKIISQAHGTPTVYFLDSRPLPRITRGSLTYVTENSRGRIVASQARDVVVQELQGRFAWSSGAKAWHTWSGSCWTPEEGSEAMLKGLHDAVEIGCGDLGFTPDYVNGIERLIRMGDCLRLPDFSDRGYIPFKNGSLDVVTGELLPISPTFAGTWCLPYDHHQDADCPEIKAWLLSSMNGDAEMVEYLRAVLAAILTGRADLQSFFYLKGDGGTGKSTFIRLAKALVGEHNAHTTDLANLETNKFETSCLYGKRLAIINDAAKYGGSIAVFKAMTGQDPLRNERKNVQQSSGSSFVFEGVVLLASNEDLVTTDLTSGIIRRQRNIEFTRVISESEKTAWRARGGEAKVLHVELPGLVNWLLQLSPEQVAEIINNPPMRAVRSNFEAMLANNRVARWLVEWCVPDPEVHTVIGQAKTLRNKEDGSISYEGCDYQLYPSFLKFCAGESVQPIARDRFVSTVEGLAKVLHHPVLRKRKPGDGRDCLMGIALRGAEGLRYAWSKCLDPDELVGEDFIGRDFHD